jgi:hypothetical protein
MWDYNEDGAAQNAWNEHREQDPVHSCPASMPSSITDADTQDGMREFAARAVLVDHQLNLIRSDLTYCVRLNRMLMEERQRVIREDVLGIKDKVEARDRKASAELRNVVQDLFNGDADTAYSYTTTPLDFYRRNRFERVEREIPVRRMKTVHGERTSPVKLTPTKREGESTGSPSMEAVPPNFGRPRCASQPLPKPYVDSAMRENKTIYSTHRLMSDLPGRFHARYVKSDDVTVKKNESWAEGGESAEVKT